MQLNLFQFQLLNIPFLFLIGIQKLNDMNWIPFIYTRSHNPFTSLHFSTCYWLRKNKQGMIGKYGLGPTSATLDPTRSAFNSPRPIGMFLIVSLIDYRIYNSLIFLIALQKTFILHRGVTGNSQRFHSWHDSHIIIVIIVLVELAMHHTVTKRGITNKNLLLGLSTGQVMIIFFNFFNLSLWNKDSCSWYSCHWSSSSSWCSFSTRKRRGTVHPTHFNFHLLFF